MITLDIALQLWGGIFYLVAKIFLSQSEGIEVNRKLRRYGWITYVVGVPAWAIVLAIAQNWIALAVEVGAIPSMILGLVDHKPSWMQKAVKTFTYGLVGIGIFYSIYDFGGITALSQVLELGVTAGFLIGTYLLAKKNPNGWLWFILMNISMGTLMAMQDKWIFATLQGVSLGFAVYGFLKSKKNISRIIIKV